MPENDLITVSSTSNRPEIGIRISHKYLISYPDADENRKYAIEDEIVDSNRVWAAENPEAIVFDKDGEWMMDVLDADETKAHPSGVSSRIVDHGNKIENRISRDFIRDSDRVYVVRNEHDNEYDGIATRLIPSDVTKGYDDN